MMTFKSNTQADADRLRERLKLLINKTPVYRSWGHGSSITDQIFTISQSADRGKDGWRYETRVQVNEKALDGTDFDSTEDAAAFLFMAAFDLNAPVAGS